MSVPVRPHAPAGKLKEKPDTNSISQDVYPKLHKNITLFYLLFGLPPFCRTRICKSRSSTWNKINKSFRFWNESPASSSRDSRIILSFTFMAIIQKNTPFISLENHFLYKVDATEKETGATEIANYVINLGDERTSFEWLICTSNRKAYRNLSVEFRISVVSFREPSIV